MPSPRLLAVAALAGLSLTACSSSGSDGSGPSGSGLSESFNLSNYRRSSDTNGTQTRPDVNRVYTQPSLPSISNRGN